MSRTLAWVFAFFLPGVGAIAFVAGFVLNSSHRRQQALFAWVFGMILLFSCMALNIIKFPLASEGPARAIGAGVAALLYSALAVFLLVRRSAMLGWARKLEGLGVILSEPVAAKGFRAALIVVSVWLLVGAAIAVVNLITL